MYCVRSPGVIIVLNLLRSGDYLWRSGAFPSKKTTISSACRFELINVWKVSLFPNRMLFDQELAEALNYC